MELEVNQERLLPAYLASFGDLIGDARTGVTFVPSKSKPSRREPLAASTGVLSERIKASVTVLEFVSQYVGLKPIGSGALGLCPFHDDHRPSFGVNNEGNYWHCFADCGGGSVIDFWMKWRACDFKTAVKELADVLLRS